MPARSPAFLEVIPPSMITPFVVRRLTTLFLEAGPLHEAEVCSQIEQVTKLAATDTPEPLLVPRGTRSVSYGLHGCPPQMPNARFDPLLGNTDFAFAGLAADGP